MSIRYGLLALLEEGPMYGYHLPSRFEARTGSTWPLNIGQVYTTLERLERDGLVSRTGTGAEGRVTYAVTEVGRSELRRWFDTPVDRSGPHRDELAIKLAMAVVVPGVDVRAVVQAQRTESMRVLQDYTRLKRQTTEGDDLSWRLVLDHLIFVAEAEVHWLDHVEATLARHRAEPGRDPVEPRLEPTERPTTGDRDHAESERVDR